MKASDDILLSLLNKIEKEGISSEELKAIKSKDFDNSQLDQLYLAAVNKDPSLFFSIPVSRRTHDICLSFVRRVPSSQYLPRTELKHYAIHYTIICVIHRHRFT